MASPSCYPDKALRVNELMDVMSHHIRREVVNYFEREGTEVTVNLDELIAHLDRRIPSESTGNLRIVLLHSHLPKLADYDWIEFDARSGSIRYTGNEHAKSLCREVYKIF